MQRIVHWECKAKRMHGRVISASVKHCVMYSVVLHRPWSAMRWVTVFELLITGNGQRLCWLIVHSLGGRVSRCHPAEVLKFYNYSPLIVHSCGFIGSVTQRIRQWRRTHCFVLPVLILYSHMWNKTEIKPRNKLLQRFKVVSGFLTWWKIKRLSHVK